jgi:hypothetical protein
MEIYSQCSVINRRELPKHGSTTIPPQLISDTIWSGSPAGLTPSPPSYTDGTDGALVVGFPDATIAARTAAAGS